MIVIVFGPSGRDHGSQNQLFSILETPDYCKQFEQTQPHIYNMLEILQKKKRTSTMPNTSKKVGTGNREDPFIKYFLNLRLMCPKNTKWSCLTILNMGPISTRKHEMGIW